MAIEIKEYVGAVFKKVNKHEDNTTTLNNNSNTSNKFIDTKENVSLNTLNNIDENSLMVDIEGIHSVITRNFTYYTPKALKESAPYWTYPYERPVIMHHNEKDGVTIGRVKQADFQENGLRSKTPGLIFTTNIAHEEGKRGIKDGTLATVSIGAFAYDVKCSICGTNIAEEGECEHDRGVKYDDKLCYWIIDKIEPKELSYVIVPSDIYAHNIRVYKPTKKLANQSVSESSSENTNTSEVKSTMTFYDNPFASMQEALKQDESTEAKKQEAQEASTQEAVIEEEVKKGEEVKATEPVEDLNKEIEKQETEDKTSKEEKSEEEKAPKEGEEKKSEEKSKFEIELEDAKKQIAELVKEISSLKKEKAKEKELRESAETELLTFRKEKKVALVEEVNILRGQLNLELEETSSLMNSSDDVLKASIKNLKEFSSINVNKIPKIESPVAVSEAHDNTTKSEDKINKDKKVSNISVEESFKNLLNRISNTNL